MPEKIFRKKNSQPNTGEATNGQLESDMWGCISTLLIEEPELSQEITYPDQNYHYYYYVILFYVKHTDLPKALPCLAYYDYHYYYFVMYND